MSVRVRLAPSPTGTLHIGTARTAIFNWLFAQRRGGRFLIRIEDTDKQRSRQDYTDNILSGLQWLGINWDEELVYQSERVADHRAAVQKLLDSDHAYRCYANEAELAAMREQQQAARQAPRHDNRHRHLTAAQVAAYQAEGREAVVRFRMDDAEQIQWQDMVRGPMSWKGADLGGDMVIARRAPADQIGDPLYNLAVVVDDAAMGISHVIRGEDHLANTAKQLLLYNALGVEPPVFAHTPLILNQEGRKLSKRDGVTSISDFQAMGYTAAALANYMCLLGWSPPDGMGERFTLEQATAVFGFERVNKAGARFDWDKLNWLNAQVLHELEPGELHAQLVPLWQAAGLVTTQPGDWQNRLAALIGPSLVLLKDGVDQARPFLSRPTPDAASRGQLELEGCKTGLRHILEELPEEPCEPFFPENARMLLAAAAQAAGVKKGVVMRGMRAALLGSLQGPDLLASWQLLNAVGEDRVRLEAATACVAE